LLPNKKVVIFINEENLMEFYKFKIVILQLLLQRNVVTRIKYINLSMIIFLVFLLVNQLVL